jgi:predicted acetyltransferase
MIDGGAAFQLVKPSLDTLPGFVEALKRGWSPDNVRAAAAAREMLEAIETDPAGFIAAADDPEARGGPITLPDGAKVARLPGQHFWMWDGEFCGVIGFRWRPGGSSLPSYVLGHIGYAVAPWKRQRGYATRALALFLPTARARGLDHVELTTDPDNLPSQKVITSNGGRLVERFRKPAAYGGGDSLRFRIDL